jgi:hypothetical protein
MSLDKTKIKELEGYLAVPDIVNLLGLSRARVHQLIDEGKFEARDMRVIGEKRMIIVRADAVHRLKATQEERAQRLAQEHELEEQKILMRAAARDASAQMPSAAERRAFARQSAKEAAEQRKGPSATPTPLRPTAAPETPRRAVSGASSSVGAPALGDPVVINTAARAADDDLIDIDELLG